METDFKLSARRQGKTTECMNEMAREIASLRAKLHKAVGGLKAVMIMRDSPVAVVECCKITLREIGTD